MLMRARLQGMGPCKGAGLCKRGDSQKGSGAKGRGYANEGTQRKVVVQRGGAMQTRGLEER